MDEHTSEKESKYKEIFRLKKMLEDAGIQHDFLDQCGKNFEFYELVYPSLEDWRLIDRETSREGCCSVAEGDLTIGREKDKLEIMGLLTEEEKLAGQVVGYLTTEDVFARIQKAEEKRQADFKHMPKETEATDG